MQPSVRHHRSHHRIGGWLPRIKDCNRCQQSKQNCSDKITYKSREAADKNALRINIEVNWWPDECKRVYRCLWCKDWHLTTATRDVDIKKVDKMRRKWLRRTHQKDDGEWGWVRDDEDSWDDWGEWDDLPDVG